ncbi:hypothetical protein B0J11DRAFT_485976 [Dendryphion nanum]|uniref:SWR1-complex protein 3 domain-containing protein n=1 Tax=Dendryphion nanum TaxID=256645 RepID=A0A9P9DXI0_9PLEO|nr:hypothetical protein B0J11DRAFT_485976 [Dendryphion nanum]
MSEPRRSTRTRAREEAPPTPTAEAPKDTPTKPPSKSTLKRKRPGTVAKELTPATPVAETPQEELPQEPPKPVLPIRIAADQPLPTLPEPQSLDLQAQEYQSIQQSGVLSASLQRSRTVWISGSNFRLFHAHFTPPKKVADRSEEDKQNIAKQKEIIKNFPILGGIEARLVIEPHTFLIRLYGPREIVRAVQKKPPPTPQYGQWPNHNQYSTYNHQQQNTPHQHPQQHPQHHQQHQQHQQYNNPPAPYSKPPPQQRPPQPKPVPRPQPKTPAPTAPAPDPVIHMLAQRAGADPQLKHIMKIVAGGTATPDQLAFFQGHITELTEILARQKEAAAKKPPPQPVVAAPPQQRPLATPQPPQQHYTQQQYPPRTSYRPLIFDFVEGNGDKLYFPSYSFMEWLPNNQGVKVSFLLTKMKPKPKPEPVETPVPSTPAPKTAPPQTPGPTPIATPNIPTPDIPNSTPNPNPGAATPQTATPAPTTQYAPPPRIEDFDEKNDIKDIEFYQPVTFTILTNNMEILQSLPRSVRPADVVEKYMDEVFDTCQRPEESYLAFRLPKEDPDGEERSEAPTPIVATPVQDVVMGGMGAPERKKSGVGRPRKSLVI